VPAAAYPGKAVAAGSTVAFFGFDLIDTPLQPTAPARLAMLDEYAAPSPRPLAQRATK
jgi:hypothetical protein